MPRPRSADATPPCYAMTLPGLEEVAADEIAQTLKAEIKRTARGLVVFRVGEIDDRLLQLRTTEDVFLLAWGTDQLTYRAADLDKIRHWTAQDADWTNLLRLHHAVRPKPKGKPTYRLVGQMNGEHGYRRIDAREAMARGLVGKIPASWKHAEENAAVEIWLTIDGATAVCGLRLSDRAMRHRGYKLEHLPASLRPTVAAAMVRLAKAGPGMVVVDPMCGAGTILAEQLAVGSWSNQAAVRVLGGDLDNKALRAALSNTRRLGRPFLARWDARRLPLADASVDRVISNPPFGVQMGEPEEIGPLYNEAVAEYDRVLRPRGRAVLVVSEDAILREAARRADWRPESRYRVLVLGQPAVLSVWRKPG